MTAPPSVDVRYVRAEVRSIPTLVTDVATVRSTYAAGPASFIPKSSLAKRLYAIRQREIAAGRLVLRDSQDILDEIEASRA